MMQAKQNEEGRNLYCTYKKNKMADEINENHTDGDSLLLLLRDAIVQHSSLNDIKLILR